MTVRAHRAGDVSSRSVGLLFIVVLHLLLAYGLIHGIGSIHVFSPPDIGQLIDVQTTVPEPAQALKLQKPDLEQPVVQLPAELPAVNLPDEPPPVETVPSTDASANNNGLSAVDTPLHFDARTSADQYYPPLSAQLGEYGATTINVCVGPNGRLTGRPSVSGSSGFQRLDEAAVRWAGEALHFTPATRGGNAVQSCMGFRVVFRLRTRNG